ncbi:hypothetical protein EI53_01234 [Fusobacterium naviforme]|nr:hypothetical protein F7P78_06170 [Fusobacterium naviforme]PSL10172.1 hypothetical protein EI53_01234 [Fusobacterium naviforme]STO27582.1 Uncharacterised protein [Fusobacterium naviforme]
MLEAGKRYMVTRETSSTVKRFPATVNWIEDRGNFWYIGYEPDDFRICRWGTCKVKKQGQYKAINYTFAAI